MSKSLCQFIDLDRHSPLKQKRKLSAFVIDLINEQTGKSCELYYLFCSDQYLLKLNKEFLQHDTFTDIITFDLSEKKSGVIQSEIYISLDRVKENAAIHHVTFQNELQRVIFHGALHLCGYKDKSKKDIQRMRAMEEECLNQFHLRLTSK